MTDSVEDGATADDEGGSNRPETDVARSLFGLLSNVRSSLEASSTGSTLGTVTEGRDSGENVDRSFVARNRLANSMVQPTDWKEDLERRERQQLIDLRKRWSNWIGWMLLAQMVVANGAFVVYGFYRPWDDVSDNLMLGWLAATLIEIVGLAAIIAGSLFPRRNGEHL